MCAAFLGLCLGVLLLSIGTVTVVPQTASNNYGYEENHKGSSNRQQDSGIFQCIHQSLLRRRRRRSRLQLPLFIEAGDRTFEHLL